MFGFQTAAVVSAAHLAVRALIAPAMLIASSLGAQGNSADAATYTPRSLAPTAVRADVALLRQALEQVHAGYDRYVPRRTMDTAFARLERRADSPMTDVSLYREIALLLAKIRCNHTKAEYPASLQTYRETHATHLPFRVRVFGRRMFVDTASTQTLQRGTEITSINGISADSVIGVLSKFVAVDGFTDFVRPTLLERDADLMGSDLDHYWPIEFGFASVWTIEARNANGDRKRISLDPISYNAWKALGGDYAQVDFANGTRWAMRDDSTAVLTIRSFVNYRTPVNADSLYRTIFTQLGKRRVRHLVVDLRANGGGSDDASNALLPYLSNVVVQPDRAVRRRTIAIDSSLRRAFSTWGDARAIFAPADSLFTRGSGGMYVERAAPERFRPDAAHFVGRVSVLIGKRDASATTMLLAVLQQIGAANGRLRLIGEETGGSAEGPTAGQVLFLSLPNSDVHVRVPLKRTDVNVARTVPGLGIFPDIDATETLDDFRARRDVAMDAALRTPWSANPSPLAPIAGLMIGELEYRDYQSGRRVLLPTWQHFSPMAERGAARGVAFRERVVYDDGPGNTIYSTNEIRVAGSLWIEGESSGKPDTLRIVGTKRVGTSTVLTLLGSGMDDNQRVEFRYTVTLGARVSKRLKEFRMPGGQWEYRHEYRFTREAVPAGG